MLFTELVAVYCEKHARHTNTLCRQNAGLLALSRVGVTIDGVWIVE
jgi:hypothetical protein